MRRRVERRRRVQQDAVVEEHEVARPPRVLVRARREHARRQVEHEVAARKVGDLVEQLGRRRRAVGAVGRRDDAEAVFRVEVERLVPRQRVRAHERPRDVRLGGALRRGHHWARRVARLEEAHEVAPRVHRRDAVERQALRVAQLLQRQRARGEGRLAAVRRQRARRRRPAAGAAPPAEQPPPPAAPLATAAGCAGLDTLERRRVERDGRLWQREKGAVGVPLAQLHPRGLVLADAIAGRRARAELIRLARAVVAE